MQLEEGSQVLLEAEFEGVEWEEDEGDDEVSFEEIEEIEEDEGEGS